VYHDRWSMHVYKHRRPVARICRLFAIAQTWTSCQRQYHRGCTRTVNEERYARVCRGLMIDGIEPAKGVQLAIQKCQSIQPNLAHCNKSVVRRRSRDLFRIAARSRHCCFLFAPTAFAKRLSCSSPRINLHVVVRQSFVS